MTLVDFHKGLRDSGGIAPVNKLTSASKKFLKNSECCSANGFVGAINRI